MTKIDQLDYEESDEDITSVELGPEYGALTGESGLLELRLTCELDAPTGRRAPAPQPAAAPRRVIIIDLD